MSFFNTVVKPVPSRPFLALSSALVMVAGMLFGGNVAVAVADSVQVQSYERASEAAECTNQPWETPWQADWGPNSAWTPSWEQWPNNGAGGWTCTRTIVWAKSPVTPSAAPTIPGAPTGVTGVAGNEQVSVSWTAPESNGGSAVTGYRVQVSTSEFGVYSNATGCSTTSTAVTCMATGLVNGTTYYFKVAAINAVGTGTYSSASAPVTPVVTCTEPVGGANVACAVGKIGPGGGLVFLISGGLTYEMATKTWGAEEVTPVNWCNTTSSIAGAVGTAVGTGSANTTAIDAACTSGAGQSAADYSANGFSDWFLPSKDELNAMYTYSRVGGFDTGTYGFAGGGYWSSSQFDTLFGAGLAWYQDFGNGNQFGVGKGNTLRVRPIRAF